MIVISAISDISKEVSNCETRKKCAKMFYMRNYWINLHTISP